MNALGNGKVWLCQYGLLGFIGIALSQVFHTSPEVALLKSFISVLNCHPLDPTVDALAGGLDMYVFGWRKGTDGALLLSL